MPRDLFNHVAYWVFDLDNTLYPPQARLFDQIEVKMTRYVMDALGVGHDEANRLRKHYWKTYGTTLAGLMQEHGVDPAPYLTEVHEISLDHLEPDARLRRGIAALPGRKIVYTNGSAPYAERVIAARGLEEVSIGDFIPGCSTRSMVWNMPIFTPSPIPVPSTASSPATGSTRKRAPCSRTIRATSPCRMNSACAQSTSPLRPRRPNMCIITRSI